MSETCVRGCVVRGQHQPSCPHSDTCPEGCIEHCNGCAPALAEDGLLCLRDGARIRDALNAPRLRETARQWHDDPTLVWAWEQLGTRRPRLDSRTGDGRSGAGLKDPEAEKLAGVLTLQAEVRDWLATTTADLSERTSLPYPSQLRLSTDWRTPPRALNVAPGSDSQSYDYQIVYHCSAFLRRHVDALLAGTGWPDPWTAEESVLTGYEELVGSISKEERAQEKKAGLPPRQAGLMPRLRGFLKWDLEVESIPKKICPMCHAAGSLTRTAGVEGFTCTACEQWLSSDEAERWEKWRVAMEAAAKKSRKRTA